MKISVIGLGKLGMSMVAWLSEHYDVIGHDEVKPAKVKQFGVHL